MLVVAGVIVYQVNGNVFPLKYSQGSVINNCVPGYLSDSVCDTITCTQMYNTGTTDPMTGGCIIETRACQDTSVCELPPPSSASPNASCCKDSTTNSISCMFPIGNCPNGSIKVGEFPAGSCTTDCQMVVDNIPSSEPIMPPIVDINPIPPNDTIDPPAIDIQPPTLSSSNGLQTSMSASVAMKTCSNKNKSAKVVGESQLIPVSQWSYVQNQAKLDAISNAENKCVASTSLVPDNCGTCVDMGINRTFDKSNVVHSQISKDGKVKAVATGNCVAIRTCNCPTATNLNSCQKI